MTEWLAKLQGQHEYLQHLEKIFTDQDLVIFKEGNHYFLKSAKWHSSEEVGHILNQAERDLEILDSVANVFIEHTLPLKIDSIIKIEDKDHKLEHKILHRTITLSPIKTSKIDFIPQVLKKAEKSESLANAVRFFRKGTWVSLYKVYEIVRDDVGGKKQLLQKKYIEINDLNRFTQTAQSLDALGDDARHASTKYKPPKEPMLRPEATTIIKDLLQKWISDIVIE